MIMPDSVLAVLSKVTQKTRTYEDAVYDTEKYVTDETDALWQEAEAAVHDGDYPTVVANLRKIWETIRERL